MSSSRMTRAGFARAHRRRVAPGQIEPVRIDVGERLHGRRPFAIGKSVTDRACAAMRRPSPTDRRPKRCEPRSRADRSTRGTSRGSLIASPGFVFGTEIYWQNRPGDLPNALRVRTGAAAPSCVLRQCPQTMCPSVDEFAFRIMDAGADFGSRRQTHARSPSGRNRFLGPRVPVVNMNVRPADRSFLDANQDIVRPYLRQGHFFQPKAGGTLAFDQRWHRFAHGVQTK